jgi:hypothetical protein
MRGREDDPKIFVAAVVNMSIVGATHASPNAGLIFNTRARHASPLLHSYFDIFNRRINKMLEFPGVVALAFPENHFTFNLKPEKTTEQKIVEAVGN